MTNREFFPQYGRVVILDDKPDEIKGLINVLSCQSIPFVCLENVPDEYSGYNNLGIRIIFLDLVLVEGVTDGKAVKSIIMGYLSTLIKENNGPYIIAIWSTQKEHYQQQIDEIVVEFAFPPIKVIYLDKSKYREYTEDLKKDLQTHFEEVFRGCELLSFISLWENAVNTNMIEVVAKFEKLLSEDRFDVNSYIYNLASMMIVEHANKIKNQYRISSAYEGLNLLLNKEANLNNYKVSETAAKRIKTKKSKCKVDKNKANTLLWIGEKYPYKTPKNVYKSNKKLTPWPFCSVQLGDVCLVLDIDITHKCTYFYKKTATSGHQFVKAVLLPKEKYIPKRERGTYLLNVGEIIYEGKEVVLVVLLNEVLQKTEEKIELKKAIFSISDELYTEIRTAIARTYGQSGKIEF